MKTYINLTTVLFTCYAALAGYYVFTCNTEIDFRLNWNMLDSSLMWILYIIGLVVSFGIKFPQYVPIIKWIDPDTGKTVAVEKDYDIIEVLTAKVVLPLLQFFIFVPLMVAAMIYYPLMCLIWLFGYIFPVLICIFYVITLAIYYRWETKLLNKFKSAYAMPLVAVATIGIIWFFSVNWIPDADKSELVTDICAGLLVVISTVLYIVFVRKYKPSIQTGATSGVDESVETTGIKKEQPLAMRGFVVMYSILFLVLLFIVLFFKKEDPYYSSIDSAVIMKEIEKADPDNNPATEEKALPAEFAAMNDWHVESITGNVKKITCANGDFVEFNQHGYIIRKKSGKDITEYNFVNAIRYICGNDAYNIEFDGTTRYDVWDSDTDERLANDYVFDSRGRIQKRAIGGYGWTPSSTFYYDDNISPPVKIVTEWIDEVSSLTITEAYNYTQRDELGNWTSRVVEVESVEETSQDFEEEPEVTRETSKRTDTRTIDYFTPKEMLDGVKYVPDKR